MCVCVGQGFGVCARAVGIAIDDPKRDQGLFVARYFMSIYHDIVEKL